VFNIGACLSTRSGYAEEALMITPQNGGMTMQNGLKPLCE
jgi:hypothetical protein